jgi:hypothetical protein
VNLRYLQTGAVDWLFDAEAELLLLSIGES